MSSITGIVAFILLAILLGKHARRPNPVHFFTVALIAFAQVAIVFYFMFTMEYPTL